MCFCFFNPPIKHFFFSFFLLFLCSIYNNNNNNNNNNFFFFLKKKKQFIFHEYHKSNIYLGSGKVIYLITITIFIIYLYL
ncbi:hypothetical protein F4703DRAFT_1851274 [Phycomyces blakesleeanus]